MCDGEAEVHLVRQNGDVELAANKGIGLIEVVTGATDNSHAERITIHARELIELLVRERLIRKEKYRLTLLGYRLRSRQLANESLAGARRCHYEERLTI